jgi:hypothetical protein
MVWSDKLSKIFIHMFIQGWEILKRSVAIENEKNRRDISDRPTAPNPNPVSSSDSSQDDRGIVEGSSMCAVQEGEEGGEVNNLQREGGEEGGSRTLNALPPKESLLWIKNEAAVERVRATWQSTGE